MATSTTTDPLFMFLIISFVINFGASAPGIKTPPIKRSHSETNLFKSVLSLSVGIILSPNILCSSFNLSFDLSTTYTFPRIPVAIIAAFSPTTPPPKITTLAGSTPGAPPNKSPLPF